MSSKLLTTLCTFGLIAITVLPVHAQSSRSTDIPKIISYQGTLSSSNTTAVSDGKYKIIVQFYTDQEGTQSIWSDEYETQVIGGLFNIKLGSGSTPLPSADQMNRPLWVGVSVNGSPELRPLTQLSSSAYALNIPNNSVTKEKIGTDYVGAIEINGKKVTKKGETLNLKDGAGINLLYDEATNSISLNSLVGIGDASPQDNGEATQYHWAENGNFGGAAGQRDITPPNVFVGTADAHDFEVHLNDGNARGWAANGAGVLVPVAGFAIPAIERVMRFEQGLGNSPNIIAGYGSGDAAGNGVSGSEGSTIGGGGDNAGPNTIASNYGVVAGGENNSIIGGADYAVIGGGQTNQAWAFYTTIAGGFSNIVASNDATIGGGAANTASGNTSTIAGGNQNQATGIYDAIGGGNGNYTANNATTIAGGTQNYAFYDGDAIGGGLHNIIGATTFPSAEYSTIGGGYYNYIADKYATIPGGAGNVISAGGNTASAMGDNLIAQSWAQTVIGGWNVAQGAVTPRNGNASLAGVDDRIFIIGNGFNAANRSNAFEVSYDGHSIVYDVNGTARTPIYGATYDDNIVYAWGEVDGATGGITNGGNRKFGVFATAGAGGVYTVTLDIKDPVTGNQITLSDASMTATISTPQGGSVCDFISVSGPTTVNIAGVNHSQFRVDISKNVVSTNPPPVHLNCMPDAQNFMFKVVGRK